MRFKGVRNFMSRDWEGLVRNPIQEGEAGVRVSPPLDIPSHIIRPDYITHPGTPFGVYEGQSTVHPPETVALLRESARIVADTLTKVQ